MTAELVGAFLLGGLLVAVTVLAIHDQQNIAGLKRQHLRLKKLEQSLWIASQGQDYRSGSDME